MKKILQIMPVPNNIAIGDMIVDIDCNNKPYINCGEIGDSGDDSRACLLALIDDDGHQSVVPLVWDYDTEAFEFTDDNTDPTYHIAAVTRTYLETKSWDDVFSQFINSYIKNSL